MKANISATVAPAYQGIILISRVLCLSHHIIIHYSLQHVCNALNYCSLHLFVIYMQRKQFIFVITGKSRKDTKSSLRSKIPDNSAAKVNVPLQLKNCKKQKEKETLDMNSCVTSTPKGIKCKKKNQSPPHLSPILHNIDSVQETSNEIIKERKDAISLSEPCVFTVVSQCMSVNFIKEKNRQSGGKERFLSRSVDSAADDFLGFPDVHPAQDLCENPYPFNTDNNQCADIHEVTKRCKGNLNISSPESESKSVILFDSWESINCSKSEPIFQSPLENTATTAYSQIQVLKSGIMRSLVQTSMYLDNTGCNAQDSAVQNSKEGSVHNYLSLKPILSSSDADKSLHINDSRSCPAQKSSVFSKHAEESLCNDVSKRHPLQDFSVDTGKSHICYPRSCPQESAVDIADKGQLLCNDVTRSNILQESFVCANQSHISDPRGCSTLESVVLNTEKEKSYSDISKDHFSQDIDKLNRSCCTHESAVNNKEKEEILCNDVSRSHCLHESSVDMGKLCINDQRSHSTHEYEVHSTYKELLCSSISEIHLRESSVDTDELHVTDRRSYLTEESTVHKTNRKEVLCSDASKKNLLQESSTLNIGTGECGYKFICFQNSLMNAQACSDFVCTCMVIQDDPDHLVFNLIAVSDLGTYGHKFPSEYVLNYKIFVYLAVRKKQYRIRHFKYI